MNKEEYILYKKCPKAYILEMYKKEEKDEPGENVLNNYKLAEEKFLEQFLDIKIVEIEENTLNMCKNTKKLFVTSKYIANATFMYGDLFATIDVLEILNKNTVNIHLISSKTKVDYKSEIEASYYTTLFRLLDININNIYIYTINSNYISEKELDIKKLFNKQIISPLFDVHQVINDIDEAKKYKTLKDVDFIKIDECCNKSCKNTTSKCPFFSYCQKELGENNIFEISGSNTKFSTKLKWYQKGITTLKKLYDSGEDLGKAKPQVEAEVTSKSIFINVANIKAFLDTLTFPIYFLDFETFSVTTPFVKGIRPYEQVTCQYSLHILHKLDGLLEHKEHLGKEGTNTKREIAERLVEDIPRNVCVLVYNMSFEKTQIKTMANEFPDLHDHLMDIHDNIKDLMIPFKNMDYYKKEMKGSYSIKYVLPALFPDNDELNYEKLTGIHNGSEAMSAFATLHEKAEEERNIIRQQLLDYCKLDTLAMVRILEKLYDIIKDA